MRVVTECCELRVLFVWNLSSRCEVEECWVLLFLVSSNTGCSIDVRLLMCVNAGKSGSKIQSTPTRAGGDRYIPNRSTMQMEVANFLLTKENDPAEESPTKKVSILLRWLQ